MTCHGILLKVLIQLLRNRKDRCGGEADFRRKFPDQESWSWVWGETPRSLNKKIIFVQNITERRDIMDKKQYLIIIIMVLCAVSGFGGYFTALKYIEHENNNIISRNEKTDTEDLVVSSQDNSINPSTKIVYEYYYADKGATKVREDTPPYFMLGLTREDMIEYYTDWNIVYFSPKEVVMRKTIYENDMQQYIIGEKDGYITVFYEENGEKNGIKEITSININGFSDEEKEKIKAEFSVSGDYDLNRVLESYGS